MSKTRRINAERFPANWAQLYALGYGELAGVIDSYIDGLIDQDDLKALYREQSEVQYSRVQHLIRELSELVSHGKPPE